ncbi:MAG TPA: hypothetical protein VIX81_11005 [Gammaproteobacteria bacterium]
MPTLRTAARCLLPALLALLVGCASVASGERRYQFDLTLLNYEKAVRWGEWQVAQGFRKPGAAPLELARYAGKRVTGYQTVAMQPSPDGREVTAQGRIDYLDEASQSTRQVDHAQLWQYDAERNRWYLLSPLPLLE